MQKPPERSEPSLCVLALPSHMSLEVEQARGCPLSRRLTGRRYVRLGILYRTLGAFGKPPSYGRCQEGLLRFASALVLSKIPEKC